MILECYLFVIICLELYVHMMFVNKDDIENGNKNFMKFSQYSLIGAFYYILNDIQSIH